MMGCPMKYVIENRTLLLSFVFYGVLLQYTRQLYLYFQTWFPWRHLRDEQFLSITYPKLFLVVSAILIAISLLMAYLFHDRLHIILDASVVLWVILLEIPLLVTESVPGLLAFGLMVTAGLVVGYQLINLMFGTLSTVERLGFASLFGLGSLMIVVFLLGLLQLLYASVFYATAIGLLFIGRRTVRNIVHDIWSLYVSLRQTIRSSENFWLFPILLLSMVAFWSSFIITLSPDLGYDANNIHLYTANIYANQHQLVEIPSTLRSYYVRGSNMLFTLGILTGGATSAALFSWIPLAIMPLLSFAFIRRIGQGSKEWGIVGGSLLITIPMVLWSSTTAYQESVTFIFLMAVLYAFFRWRIDTTNSWALALGIFAGLALFSKTQSTFLLVPVAFLVLFEWFRKRDKPHHLFLMVIPAIVIGLSWYIQIYVWTDNPLFPHPNALFESPYYVEDHSFALVIEWGRGYDIINLLRIPWDITFSATDFTSIRTYEIPLGLMVITAVLGVINRWSPHKRVMIWHLSFIAIAYSVLWIIFAKQNLRYFVFLMPVLVLITTFLVSDIHQQLTEKLPKRALLIMPLFLIITIAGGVLNGSTMWWQIPHRIPLDYAYGYQTEGQYFNRLPLQYHRYVIDAYQHIEESSYDFDPVILTDNNYFMYGYNNSSRIFHADDSFLFVEMLNRYRQQPQQIAQILRYLGVSHLLIANYPGAGAINFPPLFLQSYTSIEYQNNSIQLYRFFHNGVTTETQELLLNNNFEQPIVPSTNNGHWTAFGEPRQICDASAFEGNCFVQVRELNFYSQTVNVESEALYLFRQFARGSENAQLSLQILWHNSDNEIIHVTSQRYSLTENWQWYSTTIQAPEGSVTAVLYALGHQGIPLSVDIDAVGFFKIVDVKTLKNSTILDLDDATVIQRWNTLFDCLASESNCIETIMPLPQRIFG